MQVESILLATFTELPQISYCGLFAPMTPATTGPILIPGNHNKLNPKIMSLVSPTINVFKQLTFRHSKISFTYPHLKVVE